MFFLSNPAGFISSAGHHEPVAELGLKTRDMHRAIVSLTEKLEAVDGYNQRAEVCTDPALKTILDRNREEKKKHAAVVFEWIRRQDSHSSDKSTDDPVTDEPIAHE